MVPGKGDREAGGIAVLRDAIRSFPLPQRPNFVILLAHRKNLRFMLSLAIIFAIGELW